jgi:hypothetical protein
MPTEAYVEDHPRGIGRLWSYDPRRERGVNRMRTVLRTTGAADAPMSSLPYSRYWPLFRLPLDQDGTQSCVGHAWKHRKMMVPQRNMGGLDAMAIYREAQKIDPWAGEEPLYFGTSTEAGAEVCRREGSVERYVWPDTEEDVIRFLLTEGPVVVGTDWWSGMDVLGRGAEVKAEGWLRGGHDYVIDYWNRLGNWGMILNSWGPNAFGYRGRAKITRETLMTLIFQRGGDCCGATERRKVALLPLPLVTA